ncbi:MAG: translation initiation factor IF-3 [Patescibacteria group bacterium]
MRKNYRKSRARQEPARQYRINRQITALQVRLIDDQDAHIGVMPLAEALQRATDSECDLVEIQPQADPPVCRLTDFNKLKYSLDREWRKQRAKQKKVEVKCIRLSLRIGEHDLAVRMAQAKKFLEQNDKVKIELALRGRERQLGTLAREIIRQFIDTLKTKENLQIATEGDVNMQGGKLNIVIGLKA